MNSILNSARNIKNFIDKSIETLITFAKILYINDYKVKTNSIKENGHFIVLVNGPTLNEDIEKLKPQFIKNNLLVVNQFSTTKYFKELKPSYYVMLDGQYFFDKIENKSILRHFEILSREVDWDITLYIPSRYKNSFFANTVKKNPFIKIELFNSTLAKGGFNLINWKLYDKNIAMLQSQNVLVGALFNLIKNEAKNIYLFGAQNDWHLNAFIGKDNLVYLRQPHFYDEGNYVVQYKNIQKTEHIKFNEFLNNSAKAIAGYHNINDYAKYKECNIYNCSKNSFIDAFTRLDDKEFIEKIEK